MNRTRKAIESPVSLVWKRIPIDLSSYFLIRVHPCSSVFIRGSKELGEMLR